MRIVVLRQLAPEDNQAMRPHDGLAGVAGASPADVSCAAGFRTRLESIIIAAGNVARSSNATERIWIEVRDCVAISDLANRSPKSAIDRTDLSGYT